MALFLKQAGMLINNMFIIMIDRADIGSIVDPRLQ